MQALVKQLMNNKLSRRGFLTSMIAAGYSAAAAESALSSVAPLTQGAQVAPALTRTVTGTGGELMVDQILETGAKYMFVSNGSGLGPLVDAIVSRPKLQLIQATHEGQVVAQASGYAMASGLPGFCMHSRVGLPHSTSNMYNAMKDRTPVIVFSDHADTMNEGTDSHEDIDDWMEAIKQYTKWRWVVHQPERIPEWVRQAYKVATVLPRGPAAVRIPRDLLYRQNVTGTVFAGSAFSIPMELRPDAHEVERAAKLLIQAESPMLYVGPEVSQTNAQKAVIELAELLAIPSLQARSFYSDFPNMHPLHLGELNPSLKYPTKKVDLFLNFGARPGGGAMARGAKIIYASVDPETIGRDTAVSAALVGDLNQVAKALVEAVKSMITPQELAKRTEQRRSDCAAYTQKLRQLRFDAARRASGGPIPWQRMMVEFADLLDKDALIVDEVGTEAKILSFFNFAPDTGMTKIGRTEGRALGWGVGASVGVKLAHPNRQVVSFQGDGGFLFGQTDSLWTMSRYDIPVLTVILNNRTYEETRWQIMGALGPAGRNNRDYISYLGDPDVKFVKLAEAHGVKGELVEHSDQLRPAIQRAIKTLRDGRPYLLDVREATFGIGADVTWYQKFSLAETRERNV
jgi:thiamine pyrophosphate-dependent acetolactate synthase large subunit-like protein